MSQAQRNRTGQVYRCPVCGAEVSVIRGGGGVLAPRCCNQPMALLPQLHIVYHCPVCGAEVMVLHRGAGDFAPRCCNRTMERLPLAA